MKSRLEVFTSPSPRCCSVRCRCWQLHPFTLAFWMTLFTTVFALVLFQKGLFLCGEVKASLLSTFEPLTGIVIGMIAFQEELTPNKILGIIGVLTAAILLVLPPDRIRKKEPTI